MVHHWAGKPKAILLTTLLLLLLLTVACGAAATATPAPNPTISTAPAPGSGAVPTIAPQPTPAPQAAPVVHPGKLSIMVGDFAVERFDDMFAPGVPGAANYMRIMGGYLISSDEKRDMKPGIASQWGLSPDGLTWTFTIRKGVKWHNGSEVTPEDALWTLQHHFGPQAFEYQLGSAAVIARKMERIELGGPDKVSVTTKVPSTEFAVLVSEAGDRLYHIVPKRAKVHDIEEETAYDSNPIGAGPMGLVKHVKASVMKFERFDDFYYQPKNGFPEDKRVNFRSLDLLMVPEEATRVAAIRAGEADIVPASLPTRTQVEAGGGRLVFGAEGVFVQPLLVGCWEPQLPCHDKRVRQALDYAIDKALIRDRLYGGTQVYQVKGWNVITPSTIGYTPALDPWPFDPNKARQLLADAGYPGGRGFGTLIVNTNTATSLPFLVESAQLGAEFWKRELGLDVDVKVGDRAETRKRHRAGELSGQILWQDQETRKDATANISNSSYGDIKSASRVHEDPELFRLTQETFGIVDADKRTEATKKLYLRLRDESHILGLGYANIPWAVGPRVLTWQPYPLALFPSALHTVTLK